MVHELAHQWFGDSVAVQNWRDIWLNEGAATFMEARYAEARGRESAQAWLEGLYDDNPDGVGVLGPRRGRPGPSTTSSTGRSTNAAGWLSRRSGTASVGEAFWRLLRAWVARPPGRQRLDRGLRRAGREGQR